MSEAKWYDIEIKAKLTLLPSKVSGRETGITSKYCPNHNFGSADNIEMRMGEITIENNEWIFPGETKNASIHFVMPDDYLIDFSEGLKWRIQEGQNLIGYGVVTKVISSSLPHK